MEKIDARGLACPAPVLMTKDAIEKNRSQSLQVVVDNEAAAENVSRFLESQFYQARVETEGDDFLVSGLKQEESSDATSVDTGSDQEHQKIMVMIATDRIGSGDDHLGSRLMINFLNTIREMGNDLWRLVFVNAGVKLTIEGAETLASLQQLETEGLHILVCGTCLDHFKLLDQKQVGQTTNMLDIVMAMQFADKVINL